MDISNNLLEIKAIVKEIELLLSQSNPIDRTCLFRPYTRLYASVGQGLIEADRMGNTANPSAESLVEKWFQDIHWEKNL